ncbi:DUF4917 family protein [Cyclobacterium marinum]|uniref:DUF4917 domain-containing protein n=1 Tax=Cyclobacterium marinum (strain ATCC 25205 / DSM 745 / LMG 13164 / NCIMB 1802) TaxID=880070 RepID=G0J1J3_CYCMS|nr:DUF4917 family protein [Cyclobacterium marinum]AEL27388.1 hypothetical protein Cycma_3675 [Cyclobacterium marinum DSM 745]
MVPQKNEVNIKQWDSIEKNFTNCPLLLGNGFSLNFSSRLLYQNLYEKYIENCPEDVKKLFKEFKSTNFEKILEHLESTERVCSALKIKQHRISKNKELIKQGLIDSINRIHLTPEDINIDQIKLVSNQINNFNQIFTTNYDLFLYYLILESKKFGDYFYMPFIEDRRFKLFNPGDKYKENHVYYLHGSLLIFEKPVETIKIKRNENWLIKVITDEISKDNYPLFISEGTSEMKLKSIQSNNYLTYCFRELKENKNKNIVIYGQSLSDQDSHIVKEIDKNYDKIAISIRVSENKTINELKSEMNRIKSILSNAEIVFYDSSSLFKFE